MPHIGPHIRAQRLALGMTLRALADRARCTPGYLSEIENQKRTAPPSDEMLARLERALHIEPGVLSDLAAWQSTPGQVKRRVQDLEAERTRTRDRLLRVVQGGGLNEAHASGALSELIREIEGASEHALPSDGASHAQGVRAALPVQVPLINAVTAGYPREFTDMGYPVRVADEYVAVPDVHDPDAFAARVVGDSMEPDYREGDIVVFSPQADTCAGNDCFARFDRDTETTFKRVFFERSAGGEELIRLQPLNPKYPAALVPREEIAGLYAAVYVVRRLGARP